MAFNSSGPWCGNNIGNISVNVDGANITPATTLEILGVEFDRKFSLTPHNNNVAREMRKRASLIVRLAKHLPRGKYLRELALGLSVGMVSHALAAVAAPRLSPENVVCPAYSSIQVSLNDIARTILGKKRTDHVRVQRLLDKAGMPSANELIIRTICLEAWKAFGSTDGGDGQRNPIGSILFASWDTRPLRSSAAGEVRVPLRGENTFVRHAAEIWNKLPDLRDASTLGAARKVARIFSRNIQLSSM